MRKALYAERIMESDGGIGLWAVAIVAGPIVLGLIVGYCVYQSRRKGRFSTQISDQATTENYRAEGRQEERIERQDAVS